MEKHEAREGGGKGSLFTSASPQQVWSKLARLYNLRPGRDYAQKCIAECAVRTIRTRRAFFQVGAPRDARARDRVVGLDILGDGIMEHPVDRSGKSLILYLY